MGGGFYNTARGVSLNGTTLICILGTGGDNGGYLYQTFDLNLVFGINPNLDLQYGSSNFSYSCSKIILDKSVLTATVGSHQTTFDLNTVFANLNGLLTATGL